MQDKGQVDAQAPTVSPAIFLSSTEQTAIETKSANSFHQPKLVQGNRLTPHPRPAGRPVLVFESTLMLQTTNSSPRPHIHAMMLRVPMRHDSPQWLERSGCTPCSIIHVQDVQIHDQEEHANHRLGEMTSNRESKLEVNPGSLTSRLGSQKKKSV
jgi:hypothetical protein